MDTTDPVKRLRSDMQALEQRLRDLEPRPLLAHLPPRGQIWRAYAVMVLFWLSLGALVRACIFDLPYTNAMYFAHNNLLTAAEIAVGQELLKSQQLTLAALVVLLYVFRYGWYTLLGRCQAGPSLVRYVALAVVFGGLGAALYAYGISLLESTLLTDVLGTQI